MKYLKNEELIKLATHRLLVHYRMVRHNLKMIYIWYGRRCCEICCEYIGDDWENDVLVYARPLEKYKEKVKAELNTRENIPEKTKRKSTVRKVKIHLKTRGRGKFRYIRA